MANRVREWLAEQGRTAREGPAFELQVQTTDDGVMLRLPNLREWLPLPVLRNMTAGEGERRVLAEVASSSLLVWGRKSCRRGAIAFRDSVLIIPITGQYKRHRLSAKVRCACVTSR